MRQFADDIWRLEQHLDLGPVILTGHSMGGYIALAFAKAYPKCLRGLVLVGTKAGADSPEVAETRRATAEKVRQMGASVVVEAMAPKMLSATNSDASMVASVRAFMAPANPEGIISALLGMAERPNATDWLGKIRVPTLVIGGSDDQIIPLKEAETLVQGIPDSQLKVIPKAGHLVAFEQPDAYNEAMQTWLALGCVGVKRRTRKVPGVGEPPSVRNPERRIQ
jgi:pimeloyl-ACP methyl ester carboxylesterase